MAENSEVLDFLRPPFARLDERFDRVECKLDEVITRLSASNVTPLACMVISPR
jgi:hypothetical protein